MTITTTWDVTNLLRDSNDKVLAVEYSCTGTDGVKESSAVGDVQINGDVTVAFADITKELATKWAKDALGDEVVNIESLLTRNLTDKSGVPWTVE